MVIRQHRQPRARSWVITAAMAVLVMSLIVIGGGPALAAPSTPPTISNAPSAPQTPAGYDKASESDVRVYGVPPTALRLKPGQRPPAGYTAVQKQLCVPKQVGAPSMGQNCTSTAFAIKTVGGPVGGTVNPNNGGTYGFDETCERLSRNTGSWKNPLNWNRKITGNIAEQGCKLANVLTHPNEALQAMWRTGFGKAVKGMIAGVADGFGILLNGWFSTPAPKLANSNYLTILQSYFWIFQVAFLFGSLMLASIRIAMAAPGGETAETLGVAKIVARTVYATAVMPTIITLATVVGDAVAIWLLNESTGGDLGGKVKTMLLADNSSWAPGWVLMIAIFGMLGALAQVILLIIRQAFLIVIVGFMPFAAAGSGSGMGESAYEKMRNWAWAFVLFKPAAAAIMACAFWAADGGNDISKFNGLVLLTVAAAALPALLRAIGVSNDTAGSGLGAGSALAGLGVSAGAAIATGGTSLAAQGGGKALSMMGGRGGGGSQGGYLGQAGGTGSKSRGDGGGARTLSPAATGHSSGGAGGGGAGTRPAAPAAGGGRHAASSAGGAQQRGRSRAAGPAGGSGVRSAAQAGARSAAPSSTATVSSRIPRSSAASDVAR